MNSEEPRATLLSLASWGLLLPALAVDALNGLLVQQLGIDIRLSLLFKGAMLLVLALGLALRRPQLFALLFLPASALLLARPLFEMALGNTDILAYDIPVALRLLLLPLILSFAIDEARGAPNRFLRLATLTLYVNFLVVAGNVLGGLVGIGFATYPSTGIGFKGFFVAGNELSAVFIAGCGFVLHSTWRDRSAVAFLIVAALSLAVAALLATKAAILAALSLAALIPLVGNDRTRASFRSVAALTIAGIIATVAAWLARGALGNTAIGQRLSFVYERVGLVDLLFSGRLQFLSRYVDTLRDAGRVQDYLFGFGSTNLLGAGPQSIEIDPVDVSVMFGVPVAVILTIAAVALLPAAWRRLRHARYAAPAFLVNALLLFFALTAGHVWTSGMLGVSWMLLNGLALMPRTPASAASSPTARKEDRR